MKKIILIFNFLLLATSCQKLTGFNQPMGNSTVTETSVIPKSIIKQPVKIVITPVDNSEALKKLQQEVSDSRLVQQQAEEKVAGLQSQQNQTPIVPPIIVAPVPLFSVASDPSIELKQREQKANSVLTLLGVQIQFYQTQSDNMDTLVKSQTSYVMTLQIGDNMYGSDYTPKAQAQLDLYIIEQTSAHQTLDRLNQIKSEVQNYVNSSIVPPTQDLDFLTTLNISW